MGVIMMKNKIQKVKKRRTPKAFIRRYGRIMIGGAIIAVLLFAALFAPFITSFDPNAVNMEEDCVAPNDVHWFGTDIYGRDLFARVIYGTRITLIVALGTQFFVVIIGAVCGLLCGYYRRVDTILMRVMEGLNSLPQLLLALVVSSVLGAGVGKLMFSLVICALPSITRMMRGQVLSLREKEFIEGEKAMGAGDIRTIFLHILPNCFPYLIIRFNTGLASTVLSMASLSFLNVGLDPNIPNWGAIIADGQRMMLLHPYMVVLPGVAICLTVFGFCLFGEGLRDILDPKLQ